MKDKIYEAYKNITEPQQINEDNQHVEDVGKIASKYIKLHKEYYEAYKKALSDERSRVDALDAQRYKESIDILMKFSKDPSNKKKYRVLNGIFGPNELNRKKEKITLIMKSQSKELSKLEKEFEKAFIDIN